MLQRACTIVLIAAMVAPWLLPVAFCQKPDPDNAQKGKAESLAYASHIDAARQALERKDGEEVRENLALSNPKLRGWEHDYLLSQSKTIGQEGHKSRLIFDGSDATVESVAFSQDGQRLVIGSFDKIAKDWDFIKNESRDLAGHKSRVLSVAFSRDGKKIATGSWDGKVLVRDAKTGKTLITYVGHNPDDKRPGEHETLHVHSLCFSPDGKQIVSAAYPNSPGVRHIKPELKIWSAETGKTLREVEGKHQEEGRRFSILCVTYSPDGKLIASGGFLDALRLRDASTGKEIRMIKGHTSHILGVAFSPDGKRIATASTDKTLAVWDVATGKEMLRLKGHAGPVFSVVFSPDGKRIVSGCWDKTVRLWNADTGVELLTLGKLPGPILTVAFSPDAKRIAAGGGAPGRIADATVWDSISSRRE